MEFPNNPESLLEHVTEQYEQYHNPWLAKLLHFSGIGLEWKTEGCYLWDASGKQYLDCLGGYGVFSLGHRHPKVVQAVKNQIDLMPLSAKMFFSKPIADLSEKLAEITPEELQYSFFCNSGTEAIEGAIKVARKATNRTKFIAAKGGFHGKTMGALSATGRDKYRDAFKPLIDEFIHVPYNDVDALSANMDENVAGVILEPVQGEGGIICPDEGYLPAVRKLCDRYGALFIADEVQTGMGRTGELFAVNHQQVVPDIMTLAKALGGGVVPAGAFIGTADVWEKSFSDNPLIHTSTFGGNPLACVAGLATIQVIEEEGLIENCRIQGEKLKKGLQDVQSRYPKTLIDVRGIGLMLGVEFALDDVGELVIAQLVNRGVIAAYTLNNPRVIRFEPPLIINEAQVDIAVNAFAESVESTIELLESIE